MDPPGDDNSTAVQKPLLEVTETDAYRAKIIAFVNPKSGGLQGQIVFEQLRAQIGEQNVYDLIKDHGPQNGLKENQHEKIYELLHVVVMEQLVGFYQHLMNLKCNIWILLVLVLFH